MVRGNASESPTIDKKKEIVMPLFACWNRFGFQWRSIVARLAEIKEHASTYYADLRSYDFVAVLLGWLRWN